MRSYTNIQETTSVDQATDNIMQAVIRSQFQTCTIIAIAHRLNTIVDFDRVVVLDQGIICEVDNPQNLLARNSRFRRMWGGDDDDDDEINETNPDEIGSN